ncbi:MAG: glycine cleavage system protein GcvH [Candidatus Altiarchaeota archaeon]
MEFPKDLKYTKDHEWVKVEGDTVTVGISDYAQHALGDIVFVELPKSGTDAFQSKGIAVVESVKSVSDVYAPVNGKVVETNDKLSANPDMINKSPYKDGWMFKIKLKDKAELNRLMDVNAYEKIVAEHK